MSRELAGAVAVDYGETSDAGWHVPTPNVENINAQARRSVYAKACALEIGLIVEYYLIDWLEYILFWSGDGESVVVEWEFSTLQ